MALIVLAGIFAGEVFADTKGPEVPASQSTRMILYRGRDLQLRYPETWSAAENGDFIYIAPADGFLDGSLVYGIMIGTFDPQSGGDTYAWTPFSPPAARDYKLTLSDATNQVVAQYRTWNQNIGMVVDRGKTSIDGIEATAVDMTNESPTGVMQTNWLVTVVRPNGLVTYFVGIAPQFDFSDFRPAFDEILASVRFID